MPYSNLLEPLCLIADAAEKVLKERYNLKRSKYEQAFKDSIQWRPTIHWKTSTGYVACEAAERPFPGVLTATLGDIMAEGLPIRIVVAYPKDNTLTNKQYQEDVRNARKFGIGLICVDEDYQATLEQPGVPVCFQLPPPDFSKFKDHVLRSSIYKAYDIYSTSDPTHGLQELGQIVDIAIYNLAVQAKTKNTLVSGGFTAGNHYPLANLIEDLMRDRVIDNGVLGRCRGFVDDRNKTSHKPHNLQEAVDLETRLRNAFTDGIHILEELPCRMSEKGYTFTII